MESHAKYPERKKRRDMRGEEDTDTEDTDTEDTDTDTEMNRKEFATNMESVLKILTNPTAQIGNLVKTKKIFAETRRKS